MTRRTLEDIEVSVVKESATVLRIELCSFPIVACEECCLVRDCETCLALQHENCDREDCLYCRAQDQKREAKHYCDAQTAYYAKGGLFDTLFDGAFD